MGSLHETTVLGETTVLCKAFFACLTVESENGTLDDEAYLCDFYEYLRDQIGLISGHKSEISLERKSKRSSIAEEKIRKSTMIVGNLSA